MARFEKSKTIIISWFPYSAGGVLLTTAIAKFISAAGRARILQYPDPVLSIPFQNVFWAVGAVELMIAVVCFFSKKIWLRVGLIACLATNFLIYRVGLLWVGYQKPCSCLGNVTDALHLSPQWADLIMKFIAAYLCIGSYLILFILWRNRCKKECSHQRTTEIVAVGNAAGVN